MTRKKGKKPILLRRVTLGILFLLLLISSFLPANKFTKEITFKGCGTNLPDYEYSLRFPLLWRVDQTTLSYDSSYYEVSSPGSIFTVSCTNQGVGGDVCDAQYRTKFVVFQKEYEACFGKVNGNWNMGVLNLTTDPSTNATISFWSDGLEKTEIIKIISSLKITGYKP